VSSKSNLKVVLGVAPLANVPVMFRSEEVLSELLRANFIVAVLVSEPFQVRLATVSVLRLGPGPGLRSVEGHIAANGAIAGEGCAAADTDRAARGGAAVNFQSAHADGRGTGVTIATGERGVPAPILESEPAARDASGDPTLKPLVSMVEVVNRPGSR